MNCPACNRPTRQTRQSAADHPGTVLAYRMDGTCPRCVQIENGWQPRDRRTAPKPDSTADAVAARIRAGRAARGVPAEGTTKLRIANTRGRTLRVPQLL